MLLSLLGGLIGIAAFVCWLIILIDAFKNELWKGIVGFFCSLYLLYYGIIEFENPNKWLIVAGAFLGGSIGGALISMSRAAMHSGGY